jgi:hypothetical protein
MLPPPFNSHPFPFNTPLTPSQDPKNPTTRFPTCQFLACSHSFCPKCLVVSIEVDEVSPLVARIEELRQVKEREMKNREDRAEMKRKLEEKVERERKRYREALNGVEGIEVERQVVGGEVREVFVIE